MDLRNVRVGDYDEGEVSEGLDAVGEAGGEDGEGEVGGLEELGGCEWGAAMSSRVNGG